MANFMKVTESDGTVTVNVTDTLTVENNEVLTDADFGTAAGTVAEGNHSHQTIGDNILTGQTIDSGITAPAAVYFDAGEILWKQYVPGEYGRSKAQALFIGDGTIALNGATVDLTFDGDNLFINTQGRVVSYAEFGVKMIESLGYRIGETQFKVDYRKLDKNDAVKLMASDVEASDYFGRSVSISGSVAIVGAYNEDTGASDAGAVYVYRYIGGNWEEEAKLMAGDAEAGDYFGWSVSISGDVAIVGACNEDTGGSNAGAAYVYRYDGSSWEQDGDPLRAVDTEAGDFFGWSVSISGDVAIVGACYGSMAGAAYVYRYIDNTWSQEAKLMANDAEAGDLFGVSVFITGDVAIVGAYYEDTGAIQAGAAYVYRYNGSSWEQDGDPLKASDAEEGDLFGRSVSLSGDVAIIGAYQKDAGGESAGAAYIFRYNGSSWVQEAKLMAGDVEEYDYFGISVSIDGDVAIVGAWGEGTGGDDAGAAYVYRYIDNSWSQEAKLMAGDAEAGDRFGISVSLSGDVAIVGAYWEDTGGSNAGAAYIFDMLHM